jgi:hypothetical protein
MPRPQHRAAYGQSSRMHREELDYADPYGLFPLDRNPRTKVRSSSSRRAPAKDTRERTQADEDMSQYKERLATLWNAYVQKSKEHDRQYVNLKSDWCEECSIKPLRGANSWSSKEQLRRAQLDMLGFLVEQQTAWSKKSFDTTTSEGRRTLNDIEEVLSECDTRCKMMDSMEDRHGDQRQNRVGNSRSDRGDAC